MSSSTDISNIGFNDSECNIYTFNEQNVIINLDRDDAFISAITSQLSQHFDIKLTNKDVVLCKLPDAKIHFKEICRTCLATTDVKYILDIMYDGNLISNLLMEYTSVSVQENDMMPKHICDTCISKLINFYMFKKKCLQTQRTLEEIIKYSNTRQGACWNENNTQTPFLLHNHEYIKFLANEEIEEGGVAQTDTRIQQESGTNVNENGSNIKKENEPTIQNNEGEISCDTNLLPGDLNLSDFGNEEAKDENKQIKHKPLSCSKCGDVFQTSEELDKHRKEVRHPSKRRKLACQICGKLYTSTMMEIHMRTHTKEKPFICRICSRAFSAKNNLTRHFMIHTGERPHICHICGKGFIQARSLSEHMCTHTGEKPLLCDICGKGFSQGNSFNEHKCIQSSRSTYECKYCSITFSQNLGYRRHIQCHHQFTNGKLGKQLKEFQCIVCQKIFLSRTILKTHMLIHGEKTYLCSECGKGFHLYAGLLSHMKVHTGEKPYSCPDCGKRFSQIGSLKSHKLIHSGQRPYKCEICLKTFIQKTHLKYHVRTHSGEKPYKCSYCNKRFSLNGTLTVHIRTHTGETPYVCDVCGRGFYDSSSMKKHKRGHGDVNFVDETKIIIDETKVIIDETKPVKIEYN